MEVAPGSGCAEASGAGVRPAPASSGGEDLRGAAAGARAEHRREGRRACALWSLRPRGVGREGVGDLEWAVQSMWRSTPLRTPADSSIKT